MFQYLLRFLRNEDGPTSVEYAVMLALIIVAAMGAVQLVGTSASTSLVDSNSKMKAAGLGK